MGGRSRGPGARVPTSEALRVLVVTDAGPRVGLGHLMRTRAVVEALCVLRPVRATYLGEMGARASRLVRGWGYTLRRAGRGTRRQALQAALAQGGGSDVVIFDAYRRLEEEIRLAAAAAAVVVRFDDKNGERRGSAAVTLRIGQSQSRPETATTGPGPGRRRAGSAAMASRSAALRLAGPRHLCVRPEIVALRGRGRGRGAAGAIVVSLGGGAAPGLGQLLRRLRAAVGARDWVVLATRRADVGAGSGRGARRAAGRPVAGRRGARRAAPRLSGRVRVVSDPRAAAGALAAAPAVVCAAGTTAWEAACLGVPAVLWPRAANQRPIARALNGRAAIVCRRSAELPQALARLLKDRGLARRLSRLGRRMVDGRGARRIAQAILRELQHSLRRRKGRFQWTGPALMARLRRSQGMGSE